MVTNRSLGEKIFDYINVFMMICLMIATLYPFLYVALASISDPHLLATEGKFLPIGKGFQIEGYKLVFQNPMILIGYKNTLIYVGLGTVLNISMTTLLAYVLSRKNFLPRNAMMFFLSSPLLTQRK